ncbi:MAG: GTPase HflX [Promethearchaeota archaeon]
MQRTLVVILQQRVHDHAKWPVELAEFQQLVKAAGLDEVDCIMQTRIRAHAGFLFGRGKVRELAQRVADDGIEVVAVYNMLTSMQKYNLQHALGCQVLDRYEVVLQVFEMEARDRVSKLQLQLAWLQKSFPFIKVGERERLLKERPARRGGRGPGEYAYHAQLHQVRKRIAKVTTEIEKLRQENRRRLRKRRKLGMPMICLVGCYNAGKTSLFNALTGADKEVSDRPFTTLASKWSRSANPSMLLVDTIGFALGLDPELISAFQLNLDDMRAADLLLLVVDAADDIILLQMKLESSLAILNATGIDEERVIAVLNKADLAGDRLQEEVVPFFVENHDFTWVAASALTSWNLEELIERIRQRYLELGPVSHS